MGKALDTVSFLAVAPGTGAAMTVASGDGSAIRNAAAGSAIRLIGAWTKSQAVGSTSIIFPSGNDTTKNILYRNLANQPGNKLARGVPQLMVPQDPLLLNQIGSATAGDVEICSMMMLYDDLPGVSSRLIDSSELLARLVRLVTVADSITATVATTYSGSRALNAGSDLLRANTDYAIIGATIGATCGVLTIKGPDTGNLRCPIPGLTTVDDVTSNWFKDMSEWHGLPVIPVVNSANKTGTFIEILQDENLVAVPFSLLLAELSSAS